MKINGRTVIRPLSVLWLQIKHSFLGEPLLVVTQDHIQVDSSLPLWSVEYNYIRTVNGKMLWTAHHHPNFIRRQEMMLASWYRMRLALHCR